MAFSRSPGSRHGNGAGTPGRLFGSWRRHAHQRPSVVVSVEDTDDLPLGAIAHASVVIGALRPMDPASMGEARKWPSPNLILKE